MERGRPAPQSLAMVKSSYREKLSRPVYMELHPNSDTFYQKVRKGV